MRLCRPSEAPEGGGLHVFKNRSWRPLIGASACMGVIAGAVVLLAGDSPERFLAIVPGFLGVLILVLALHRAYCCTRPPAWLLKAAPEGIYVNLRSFRNYRLPQDEDTICFLAPEDIVAVSLAREVQQYPKRRGYSQHYYLYLDLLLREMDMGAVRDRLREERRRPYPGKRNDYPVRLIEAHGLRLVWDWVHPAEKGVLAILGQRYPVAPSRNVATPEWENISDEERDDVIDALWVRGECNLACRLAWRHRRLDRRQARHYLDARLP